MKLNLNGFLRTYQFFMMTGWRQWQYWVLRAEWQLKVAAYAYWFARGRNGKEEMGCWLGSRRWGSVGSGWADFAGYMAAVQRRIVVDFSHMAGVRHGWWVDEVLPLEGRRRWWFWWVCYVWRIVVMVHWSSHRKWWKQGVRRWWLTCGGRIYKEREKERRGKGTVVSETGGCFVGGSDKLRSWRR